jgi:hypothetical protein
MMFCFLQYSRFESILSTKFEMKGSDDGRDVQSLAKHSSPGQVETFACASNPLRKHGTTQA